MTQSTSGTFRPNANTCTAFAVYGPTPGRRLSSAVSTGTLPVATIEAARLCRSSARLGSPRG
jgi:hypothetical protein